MKMWSFVNSGILRVASRLGYERSGTNAFGKDPFADVAKLTLNSPNMIFDVGANEGKVALRIRKHFPDATIHCFEPFAPVFCKLEQNFKDDPFVYVQPLALGAAAGRACLYENADPATNSLLPNADNADLFQPGSSACFRAKHEVQVTTVDDYCCKKRISKIDILKIDTQGFDLNVLRGASQSFERQRISYVLAEVLFVPLYSDQAFFHEVYDFMMKTDFGLIGLYECARRPCGALAWCDALFRAGHVDR